MLEIQRFEPFYTRRIDDELRIVLAYSYCSIIQDDELFHFIPVEGKDIRINLKTLQICNMNEVFVFQKDSRFIRLPIYQLLLVSDIHDHIQRVLNESDFEIEVKQSDEYLQTQAENLVAKTIEMNRQREINRALDNRDKAMFMQLVKEGV